MEAVLQANINYMLTAAKQQLQTPCGQEHTVQPPQYKYAATASKQTNRLSQLQKPQECSCCTLCVYVECVLSREAVLAPCFVVK
jgi:hypothetical protein